MIRHLWVSFALLALLGVPASAQNAAPDVKAVLAAADKAMGASQLKSLQYSGVGYVTVLGQNYSSALDDTWPRFDLKNYTRTIDYPSMSMKEEQVRVQGAWPANRGGGIRPIVGERKQTTLVSGKYAWNVNDQNAAVPQPTQGELREMDILLTPHGFIRAALAAKDATVSTQSESSRNLRKVNIVTFKALGKYPIMGWIGENNLITKVETWLPHPILGDMFVEMRVQGGYKDYNGIKFPAGFHESYGNPPHPALDIDITDVKPNVAGAALQVPDAVRQAMATPPKVQSKQLAPGVWLLDGAPYRSLAVEFKDYAVVVEAPIDQEWGEQLLAETKRLTNKPVHFVVNTHHHFDHSGGLRAFGADDTIVITHESNFNFYEGVVFDLRPRLVQPDKLSVAPRQVHYVLVKDHYAINDGARTMDIYHLDALEHAADMLVVYLPKEKILLEADMFDPPAPGAAAAPPSANTMNLLYNLQRLNIQPEQIVSVHSGVFPVSEFLKAVGQTAIVERGGGLNAQLNQ